jgi:hypothetical protein
MALEEFEECLLLDPTNAVALEKIKVMKETIEKQAIPDII